MNSRNRSPKGGSDPGKHPSPDLDQAGDIENLISFVDGIVHGDFSRRAPENSKDPSILRLEQSINLMMDNLRKLRTRELQQVFDSTASAMRLIDLDHNVLHVNRAMEDLSGIPADKAHGGKCYDHIRCKFCQTDRCPMVRIENGEDRISGFVKIKLRDGRKISCLGQATAHRKADSKLIGIIEDFRDITEQRELLARLEDSNRRLSQTQEHILSMSTPVVQVWDKVLALPLIGVLDSRRAQQAMEIILERIVQEKARVVIVDITGVPLVDSLVASYLAQTLAAVKLIGAEGVLTGISANVAQTLVKLGIDVGSFTTRSNLAAGLKFALEKSGLKVSPV